MNAPSPAEHPATVPSPRDASMHDMLRIMDVASTLRRQRETAESQLDLAMSKLRLRERLLATATAAGEPVTPAEVDAAIEQYFATQHRYEDPPPSWARFWANVWVMRTGVVTVGLLVAAAIVGVWAIATQLTPSTGSPAKAPEAPPATSVPAPTVPPPVPAQAPVDQEVPAPAPRQALTEPWERFQRIAEAARGLAADDDARARVAKVAASGQAAFASADGTRLDRAQRELDTLVAKLEDEFVIEVVDRMGVKSGVERLDSRGNVSGYYVIVEATAGDNRALSLTVRDAESGQTKSVSRWGEQVPEPVYRRLVADKQSDGVLDERSFVRKQRGVWAETVVMPGTDGKPLRRGRQITQW